MSRDSMGARLALILASNAVDQRHLSSLLSDLGYEPVITGTVAESLAALSRNRFSLSLVDLDPDGAELLRCLKAAGGSPGPIIVIAERGGLARLPEATALGVHDVLEKPFAAEDLEQAIKSATARPQRTWSPDPNHDHGHKLQEELTLWQSPRMLEVREIIRQAARADITVLICGETGTGKDLVARAIHEFGVRRAGPFVKVNCAAVPRELLESELFGHERGAFTGAHQLKLGKFESADHGTIFLDEIGDLHPALQGKLLHVLQDGQFSRVGGRSTIKVDVRVLAATNQNLEQAVAAGRFRDDLYYRLNVIQIEMPPLRERLEEIPLLAEYFAQRYAKLYQREGFTLSPEMLERLLLHRYPGNVRELENIVKRIIVLGDPGLARDPVPASTSNGDTRNSRSAIPARVSLKEIGRKAAKAAEREAILLMLKETHWNRVKASKALSISYRALLYKLKDAGLGPGHSTSKQP